MKEFYYPSSDGKTDIHCCIWLPKGDPVAVVQIIHGMCEYAKRYSPFAEKLTECGFVVCAEDHLGHGQSVTSPDKLGYFCDERDWQIVLKDIRELQERVKAHFGALPYFVLGHSMGSFFCRNFIAAYGDGLSGAVIMGTGHKSCALLNTALTLVKLNARFNGWEHRSPFLKKLAFGSYNKKFGGGESSNKWLSADAENVAAYDGDPLCGFDFTDNGYYVLFSVIKNACSADAVARTPDSLPLFFVSGADDPVGSYGKAVKKAYKKYEAAGKNCQIKLYTGARHEILNERSLNAEGDVTSAQATADIIAFFMRHIDDKKHGGGRRKTV